MGKIKKVPTERHNATASPAITEFVNDASSVPLHQLPAKLAEFPSYWPHPRGDLYHWIPLLDRFDHVFELFNQEYGLDVGPQTQPFERKLLLKGDAEDGKPYPGTGAQEQELDTLEYPSDGDRVLIEHLLSFTRLLLERCGNRSLYASSGHINDLLHTTSLSLLQACLQLSLRLAQRYQVARFKNTHPQAQAFLLNNHYNINLDNMHKLALPIHKLRAPAQVSSQTPAKPKDKAASNAVFNPADLVAIAKNDYPAALRKELATVVVTYMSSDAAHADNTDGSPSTPTPVRRQTPITNTQQRPGVGDRTASSATVSDTPTKSRDSYFPSDLPKTLEISASDVSSKAACDLVRDALPQVPKEQHFELLHRIRIAKAFAEDDASVRTVLNTRLLAISNLAYALSESKFQERIGVPDTNEARRYHLAPQLCDLLQPTSNGQRSLPLESETIVLETIEALARCKHKSGEIVDALAVSVNHGVLYYELRHAIASLRVEADPNDAEEVQRVHWRNAIFDLVTTVSQINNHVKCAEKMVAAGIMEILVEALTLRTSSAERIFEKIMGFLTSFIHGIATAFQALASAKGLEIITELASYEVTLAMQRVRDGEGMPERSKSKVVDYSIPYYQQATLRSVFKFVVYLFDHNSGVHDRLLRNLLDSPQTLGALREIIGNANVFGSNVWDAAINTVTNFIHNEPTSFQVIAEAGLAKGILEAVTQKPLPDGSADAEPQTDEEIKVVDGQIQYATAPGILPVSETICDIPTAFGAICLNEDGMAMFLSSGALDAYLNIFLSPPHVRALEEEGQTAFSIGNAFDELSRHHPGLQDTILAAVTRALKRVHSLALLNESSSSAEFSTQTSKTTPSPEVDDKSSTAKALNSFAPAIPYITAFFKFIEGFFHNSTMCQKFCRAGAGSMILDLITSPAAPYDLTVFPVIGKMANVVNRMAEEKPHLILPDLLSRTVEATEKLKGFATYEEKQSYFQDFTDPALLATADQSHNIAKALADFCALCTILGRILNTPSFGGRGHANNQLLTTMNFADVYSSLIDTLGLVYSKSLWEGLILNDTTPAEWKAYSDTESLSVRNVDSDGIVHTSIHCAHCGYEHMEGRDDFFNSFAGEHGASKLSSFKNIRLLRFLLGQMSQSIGLFFQNVSHVLAPKRTADQLQKHYAAETASSLATSVQRWFNQACFVSPSEDVEVKYLDSTLGATYKIFLRPATNMESFGSKEACTLALRKFFFAGGFTELAAAEQRLVDILSSIDPKNMSQRAYPDRALDNLLEFYAQITRSKCINEAAQSNVMTVRQPEHPDFFTSGQFLVELRLTTIQTIAQLWRSSNVTKIGARNVKRVIEILRNVLKAEGEERAIKRVEKATRRVASSAPSPSRRLTTNLDKVLAAGFDADLAAEAIYRCFNHGDQAIEYCQLRVDHSAPRFPPPSSADDPPSTPTKSTTGHDQATNASDSQVSGARTSNDEHQDSDDSMSEDEDLGSLDRLAEEVSADLLDMGGDEIFPRTSLTSDAVSRAIKDTGDYFITVDDLNDERDRIRADLIDRCLDVLSVQSNISFDLAELVQVAVSTDGAISRADWGSTLVSSLLSLQAEEPSEATGQKIAAYAHLVALILQDLEFFEATLDELRDNFDALVSWLHLAPDQNAEKAPWIEMILLIIERILVEDEQPVSVEFIPPPADQPLQALLESAIPEPIVPHESRAALFSAVVDVLPKIGKQQSLALSVCRILVMLTRRRELAKQFCDKLHMSRLFLMVRQLAGPVNERLQTSILLILRHLVEDEETIRQTMKTEIHMYFFGLRVGRGVDTTAYVRSLSHLVIRDTELFIDMTKEMVQVLNYSGQPNRPQYLMLKLSDTELPEDASQPSEEVQDDQAMTASKQLENRTSAPPEGSDGVVQYLLRELSNYKEVDDRPVIPKPAATDATNTTTGEAATQNADAAPAASDLDKNERPVFEAKDNMIYIYRCFIIQCLSELLGCYSRLKLEFINFSRRAESQVNTPSKPRSGTINYLLNQLLPVGTLEHRDSIEHRKKVATSEWATILLVSLCCQTHEKPYSDREPPKGASIHEEPDLTFVRKFVLEHAIRSFKDALTSAEPQDVRYSRLLALADLFDRMLNQKSDRANAIQNVIYERQSLQFGRLMYEKNFVGILTSSIAELDLNFPNAKRAVKHILGPLKTLTDLAVDLSQRGELSSTDPSSSMDEDGISLATSVSDDEAADDDREQTPDLFRNSTLSMFEASGAHPDESESEADEDEDEDEEMFEAGFDDEMDFEDGNGETISDEDDEDIEVMEGMDDMGEIEGLPGDMQMEVEIVEEDSDDDDDDDEDNDDDIIDDDEDDDSQDDDADDDEDDDDPDRDDFFHDIDEINGDEENASLGELQEGVWEEEAGFAQGPDDDGHSQDVEPLEQLARIIGADDHSEFGGHPVGVVQPGDGEFFEDELPPEDDGEEGEEEDYEGEFGYEPEAEDDDDEAGGWEFDLPQHLGAFTQRLHRHRHGLEDLIGRVGDHRQMGRFHRGHHHHHHHHGQQRGEDEGINPLLQRNAPIVPGRERRTFSDHHFHGPPFFRRAVALGRGHEPAMMLQEFMTQLDRSAFPGGGQVTVTMNAGPGAQIPMPMRNLTRFLDMEQGRDFRETFGMPYLPPSGRSSSSDEALAVDFKPAFTAVRWEEEARLMFGNKFHEKASLVINALLKLLVPPAMEQKRKRDAEKAEQEAAEERAREEARKVEAEKAAREAEEQKRKEEEEEQARLAAETAARAADASEPLEEGEDDTEMSGTGAEDPQAPTEAEPAAPRITATIRGREVDITNLGIDHEYLQALPEELREEVIMSQYAEQRTQAQQAGEPPNEISREFLAALPPEIQQELLRQEATERRRRERDEARRQPNEAGPPQPAQGQDIEAVDFLAMLDPGLRQQILMDARQDEDYLNTLPEDIQREARALLGDRRGPNTLNRLVPGAQPRLVSINGRQAPGAPMPDKTRARPVVQMLDKAGVATLLRLMFITLHQSARASLRGILADVCKNTQNRAEVISILLSILQDGTADVNAVERSFAHLSLRAKQSSGPKTPQPLKRSLTNQLVQPVSELSPLNIVQQCLSTLNSLSSDNPKVQTFFLSEHETLASQKSKTAKKGKSKELTASKYPLNALLTLLDRKLITENTGVMETLAALLSRVTSPLQILVKKAKQAQEQAESTTHAPPVAVDPMEISTADVRMQEPTVEAAQAESSNEQTGKKKRSLRELEAPNVPEENIRLVVNILAARECPSKTFSDTLDIIKHMAAIPGAKEVFGRELIRQASELGGDVVTDLTDLTKQINDAHNGADIQGMALVSFSSAGSKQRKLLRILVALDHLFDPKRMAVFQNGSASADTKLKEDILASLYESDTFQNLWKDLSLCLTAIRQRGDLVNVATVLLPLIESLMVVCRNSTLKDAAPGVSQTEVTVSTPPPEARMEGLFFTFTEEHRKILNELIRNNPKLMNGNLSVLAKNSKVLEFDNKRSYFNRKLHNRGSSEVRVQHPALTLNVRRDEVFMDSYKALFFKSGEEIKNGKLNIRFNGEEGIDAGGVSREWFAVMARQMFNPDFALFNPVASDRTTFHPNNLSGINEEHLPFFKFIGRVIGKALYEGRVLDCHFSRAVYRRILGKSVSLKDMESLDLEYYKSLVWILENDITDIAFETFSVEVDRFGVVDVVDLIENGRNIAVTEDNKQEYVRLVVEHRLIKSVEEQLDYFLKGFHDIIPAELISIFNEQELELLISGLPEIDVDDWKNNTEYHNYQATSAQIQWFWRAVKSFDPEERAKLLQFVTGTSKVPLNGFKELEGMNGFARFNIHRDYSSKEKLPTSHTCFNQLDLPEYESYEHLRQQLYTAITAGSEYFGFA